MNKTGFLGVSNVVVFVLTLVLFHLTCVTMTVGLSAMSWSASRSYRLLPWETASETWRSRSADVVKVVMGAVNTGRSRMACGKSSVAESGKGGNEVFSVGVVFDAVVVHFASVTRVLLLSPLGSAIFFFIFT